MNKFAREFLKVIEFDSVNQSSNEKQQQTVEWMDCFLNEPFTMKRYLFAETVANLGIIKTKSFLDSIKKSIH